jgi:type IV pilus assembly protein PilW
MSAQQASPLLHRRASPAWRQSGLSLVELMIALTIGLILLAGVAGLIVEQSRTRNELDKSTRQIENGRYAVQILQDDIQLAGYYGEYYTQGTTSGVIADYDPCLTTVAGLDKGFALPIQGYDAPSSSPITSCLAGVNHMPDTDILVVRRANTSTTAGGTAGQAYLQTNVTGYRIGTTSATAPVNDGFSLKKKDGTTAADLRRYHVHIYFISPCSMPADGGSSCTGASDDDGRPIPTLKRLELDASGGATVFNLVPLVEGIENLQLDYGLDTDGDGAPDSYVTGPSLAQWLDVVSVRINLLARNNEPSAGYSDNKTYNLGLTGSVTPTGSDKAYKRHAYTAQVRVVNPSSRREQP